jgi:hypothetical protein
VKGRAEVAIATFVAVKQTINLEVPPQSSVRKTLLK